MLAGSAFGIAALSGGLSAWAIVGAGTLGAALVMVLVSLVAWRIQDSMTLLIVGLMFGSAVSAIVSVLSYYSGAEALKLLLFGRWEAWVDWLGHKYWFWVW